MIKKAYCIENKKKEKSEKYKNVLSHQKNFTRTGMNASVHLLISVRSFDGRVRVWGACTQR